MIDLPELAARCEAATGPDRAIDHAITTLLGRAGVISSEIEVPAFTASLDLALSVVPPRVHWLVHLCCTYQGGPLYTAIIVPNQAEIGVDEMLGGNIPRQVAVEHIPTPALAICAAALKWRAEIGGGA